MTHAAPRPQVAVIGLGRLGTACALALLDEPELALAGVVRRPTSTGDVPGRLQRTPVAGHVRDLPAVDVALVCVPAGDVAGVAHDLLQARIAMVECAALEGEALVRHHEALDDMARRRRATAVVGAGWNPGVLPLLQGAFETLIPRGHTARQAHPGVELHHVPAAAAWPGVRRALEGELGGARYVYVELERGASLDGMRAHVEADPVFAGQPVQLFAVDDASTLEDQVHEGLVLERVATVAAGRHASLLLEARFDVHEFAARAMLDAARKVTRLTHGAHRYAIGL
jgi:diaminopimelate dehydrogenase